MKRALLFILSFWLISLSLKGQVIINEIQANGTVELKNIGNSTVNVANYWLCDFPAYQQIENSNVICGDMMLGAGEILAVDNFNTIAGDDGEMGLYSSSSFSSSDAIVNIISNMARNIAPDHFDFKLTGFFVKQHQVTLLCTNSINCGRKGFYT